MSTILNTPKRLARIAELLSLIVASFGGFAVRYVITRVYAPGDAATTAANVLTNAGLVRMGLVADFFQATVFAFLGMTLYLLLRHVHKNTASKLVCSRGASFALALGKARSDELKLC
jgi:hypothetical protein